VRWTPLLVALVFLASALLWLRVDPRLARHAYGAGSSLSTAPEGLSLARAYLAGQGVDVGTWARNFSRDEPTPDAVVFRVTPWSRPKAVSRTGASKDGGPPAGQDEDDGDQEQDDDEDGVVLGGVDAGPLSLPPDAGLAMGGRGADGGFWPFVPAGLLLVQEARFIAAGGRLVLAVNESYGPLKVEPSKGAPLEKVFLALPGVEALEPLSELGLAGPGLLDSVAVFERGPVPVLARRAIGKGELWLLSAPELFFNARLGERDNLVLLVALAGQGRPVLFDESVHGLFNQPGVLDMLRRWGFGPALVLLALFGGVWFWRRAVTLGPPGVFRDVRTESVDLVHAVAQLYQRALRPQDALALHHGRLVHDIQLRQGLGPEAAAEKARQFTEGWEPPAASKSLSSAEFQGHLDVLNRAIRRLHDERPRRA
jgi:hypothetical protein